MRYSNTRLFQVVTTLTLWSSLGLFQNVEAADLTLTTPYGTFIPPGGQATVTIPAGQSSIKFPIDLYFTTGCQVTISSGGNGGYIGPSQFISGFNCQDPGTTIRAGDQCIFSSDFEVFGGGSEIEIGDNGPQAYQYNITCGVDVLDVYFNTQTGPSQFDLSVGMPVPTQAGASINPQDNLLDVAVGMPVKITVPVTGMSFNNPETRSTTVTLATGSQPLQSQTISLADIQSGAVTSATFTVTFDPSLAGTTQTITATIDPGNALGESNYSNNTASVQVDVTRNVQLVKIIVDPSSADGDGNTLPVPDPDNVSIVPSINVTATGCSQLNNFPSALFITMYCQDVNTKENVDGCTVALNLSHTNGQNDGGHHHTTGVRPLSLSLVDQNNAPITPSSQISISSAGTTVNYTAPEVSGEVIMNFNLQDPKGVANPANPTSFEVSASETYFPISIQGMAFVDDNGNPQPASHPGDGFYGTATMSSLLTFMTSRYYKNGISFGVVSPDTLHSEGASLSWGGLFDANWDGFINGAANPTTAQPWMSPHCGHRNGKQIDISRSNLTDPEEAALAKAVSSSNLKFYEGESPNSSSLTPDILWTRKVHRS